MSTLNSGGANGADLCFARCAASAGHTVRHYHFKRGLVSHALTMIVNDFVWLTQEQLNEADPYLKEVNKTLKRTFPAQSDYTNNLLRRNYWQIKDTEMVYAVAPLMYGNVLGGTAWAIEMAKYKGVVIHLFDVNLNRWMRWSYMNDEWDFLAAPDALKPNLFSIYTGIGSRNITVGGIAAIEGLYK